MPANRPVGTGRLVEKNDAHDETRLPEYFTSGLVQDRASSQGGDFRYRTRHVPAPGALARTQCCDEPGDGAFLEATVEDREAIALDPLAQRHARISLITCPCTSVRRKSRPAV